MKIVINLISDDVTYDTLRVIAESPDCCLGDGELAIRAEVVGIVTAEDSPGDQRVMAVIPLNPQDDNDFPVVCANGCPEGYLGRHKFSCDQARPR